MNYYYRDNAGKEIGPLALTALAKLRFAGVINGDTPVRIDDSNEWKPCREIIADPQAPAATTPQSENPTLTQVNAPASKGYGGWLAVFCVWHSFLIPGILLLVIVPAFLILDDITRQPTELGRVVAINVSALALVIYGFYAGLKLSWCRTGAVRGAKRFLFASLIWALFVAIQSRYFGNGTGIDLKAFQVQIIVALGYYFIWFRYFEVSNRIKATFPQPVDAPRGLTFEKRDWVMAVVFPIIGLIVYEGVLVHCSLLEKTTLSFGFSLDNKPLPAHHRPSLLVDGRDFVCGDRITLGRHKLSVHLPDAEPLERVFWVSYGIENLGVLPLESSKGTLSVIVNPSPATVIVKREGVVVHQGDAPLKVEKLPVGDYSLAIRRGEYEENWPATIQRQQLTEIKADLNLGSVELSSDPTDAEYVLSGNGKTWSGKLPAKIADMPVGGDRFVGILPARKYDLIVRRKGWEQFMAVLVSRGSVLTNKTEFPYGSLEITTEPTGLMVATNGVEIGKSPVALRELKPGQYNLTASDGENDLFADVKVGPKETAKHAFVFRYSSVQLDSTPSGATVIRKGKQSGKTPLLLNRIPVGETAVELRLDGYTPTNFSIRVTEGTTASLTAKLISVRYLEAMKFAREALKTVSLADARRHIATALEAAPNDEMAIQLGEDVAIAERKVEEDRKEAERRAEIARKEVARSEGVAIIEKAIRAPPVTQEKW